MGMSQSVYVGPYLKVEIQKYSEVEQVKCCPNFSCPAYGQYSTYQFCQHCGTRIALTEVKQERDLDLGEIMLAELGDEDLFSKVYELEDGYDYLVANMDGQGGEHLENNGQAYPIKETMPASGGDWDRMCAVLDTKGIKYERLFGVVTWWS